MIKQSKRMVLLLLVTTTMAFGSSKEFEDYLLVSLFNTCASVTGATLPKFKSAKELLAYEKKNQKTLEKVRQKYNLDGCMETYGQLLGLFAVSVGEICTQEAMFAGLTSGVNQKRMQTAVEKCLMREIKKAEPALRAELKRAKPFPRVDKAAQAQKEREEELERQRQIQAQAEAERLEAIEKENRILATRLAALGEFIWEGEYHRIYTESKKDRYTQDLQGCIQEQQENLNTLAKEAKYFSREEDNEEGIKINESIKKQGTYQALAYCVIKPHFVEYEARVKQEKWQEIKAEVLDSVFIEGSLAKNETTLNKHIEKLALANFEASWAKMAENNGYDDYENTVVNPWFAKNDVSKILAGQVKEPLDKLDTLKAKLFEESNPQYKQCDKDFFRNKKKEECRQNELNSSIRALEEQIENLIKEI